MQGAFCGHAAMLLLLLDGIPLSWSHPPFYLVLQHTALPTCAEQGQAQMNTCMSSSDHCTNWYLCCRSTARFPSAILRLMCVALTIICLFIHSSSFVPADFYLKGDVMHILWAIGQLWLKMNPEQGKKRTEKILTCIKTPHLNCC